MSPLVQGSDGAFYGTSVANLVFKMTPAGKTTVLHNFSSPPDGSQPVAGLLEATDGNFYGVTLSGGTMGYGTIYRISPTGSYSVLYNFDGITGESACVTLLQHTDGILYGETNLGGTNGVGVFYSFDMGLGPFVSLVSTSGKVGKTIEVLGQGFTGTTAVSFNGTSATFNVVRDTYLKATVPNGATTGPVTVTTPGATLTSNTQFRVTPKILSFSPTTGPVGTPVTITGNSLTQTTKVTFGGVKATTFTVNSDTQVTANVPTAAKTGRIAITTAGGWTWSPGIFTVTQ